MQKTKPVYVVTGLPRSGTSLMMQMLLAGGLPVLSDLRRQGDAFNPKGYWEWEAVKKLETNPQILSEAQGKAVKIISHFLPFLPISFTYKIIFMRRKTVQIVRSQNRMLQKEGMPPTNLSDERLVEIFNRQLAKGKQELQRKEIPFHEVWYEHILQNPKRAAEGIVSFIGQPLDAEAMRLVVDTGLNHFK
jgi:hypothetical protein